MLAFLRDPENTLTAAIYNLVIFLYLAALIVIGPYADYRQEHVDTYYVAGRRQGSFSMVCLWLACWIGGASIIGRSGKAYEAGVTGICCVGALALARLLNGLSFTPPRCRRCARACLQRKACPRESEYRDF